MALPDDETIDSPDDETKSALDDDTIASPESTSQQNSYGRDCRLDAMTTIRNNSTVDVICVDETDIEGTKLDIVIMQRQMELILLNLQARNLL